MRYNRLGGTGIKVSEICLGTMTFGGKGFWTAIGTSTRRGRPIAFQNYEIDRPT